MVKYLILAALIALVVAADRQDTLGIKLVYGTTHPTPRQIVQATVKRYGSAIELRPEKEQYYRELHADVWPGVLRRSKRSKFANTVFIQQR